MRLEVHQKVLLLLQLLEHLGQRPVAVGYCPLQERPGVHLEGQGVAPLADPVDGRPVTVQLRLGGVGTQAAQPTVDAGRAGPSW